MVKNKMNGEERRNKIIDYIEHSPVPVSGTALANHFSVSRQAVVQDIALLRASGNDIPSTNRGYVIAPKPKVFTRTFKVSHSDDQTDDELSLIVDLGGKVLNVFVDHNVYGRFEAKLDITSRRDVARFIKDVKSGNSSLLKNVTCNEHFHTIEAPSEEILDEIEQSLKQNGYIK